MSDHTDVLLEDINGKFDIILEAVGGLQEEMKGLAKQPDLEEVKTDVTTIKLAVTGHSEQLTNHENRIGQLEVA